MVVLVTFAVTALFFVLKRMRLGIRIRIRASTHDSETMSALVSTASKIFTGDECLPNKCNVKSLSEDHR